LVEALHDFCDCYHRRWTVPVDGLVRKVARLCCDNRVFLRPYAVGEQSLEIGAHPWELKRLVGPHENGDQGFQRALGGRLWIINTSTNSKQYRSVSELVAPNKNNEDNKNNSNNSKFQRTWYIDAATISLD
jgi:hypothetical protein